jgi:hypothetical protein
VWRHVFDFSVLKAVCTLCQHQAGCATAQISNMKNGEQITELYIQQDTFTKTCKEAVRGHSVKMLTK